MLFSPADAKRAGRSLDIRVDWEEIKVQVMLTGLRLKFAIPELRQSLIETRDATLIEGNNWHDNIWGQCGCSSCYDNSVEPQNLLGNLLMQVRDETAKELS